MDLVSVIIPVYNCENFLEKCLNSIMAQTYTNLELVLIDDGSTDGSGQICDLYTTKDERIKAIHQENKGVSAARNNALKIIKGKYVTFVDSDDWVENDYIETLYEGIERNNADLSICGSIREDLDGNIIPTTDPKNKRKYTREQAVKTALQEHGFQGFLWNKLFKTDLIIKHHITLNEKIKISEDLLFVTEYLKHCNTVYEDSLQPVYHYVYHDESAMISLVFSKNFKPDWLTAVYVLDLILKEYKGNKHIKKLVIQKKVSSCAFYLRRMIDCGYHNEKAYSEMLSFVRKYLYLIPFSDMIERKIKLKIFLCAISPKLEIVIWKTWKKVRPK